VISVYPTVNNIFLLVQFVFAGEVLLLFLNNEVVDKISLIDAWLLGRYSSSFLSEFFGRNYITGTGIENNPGQMAHFI